MLRVDAVWIGSPGLSLRFAGCGADIVVSCGSVIAGSGDGETTGRGRLLVCAVPAVEKIKTATPANKIVL
ncbi:MAG: hypothetical protein QUS14_14825 [Pyrinomonadaceae bacterium]|nr:hypothetical protein [Pyrinomonadaceae bacterium]